MLLLVLFVSSMSSLFIAVCSSSDVLPLVEDLFLDRVSLFVRMGEVSILSCMLLIR